MEFQLPSVLQKKLTPYDEVRRKVEAEKKKAVRKASKTFSSWTTSIGSTDSQ